MVSSTRPPQCGVGNGDLARAALGHSYEGGALVVHLDEN